MGRAKILVVEDDPALREGYARVLHLADYEVSTAGTGQECLSAAAAEPPDLIVLDFHLPDVSGIEVCRRIKAAPALSRVQVIMVTGVATSSDDQATGIEAGADAYLPKPVYMRTLLAHVQTMLQARQAEAVRELASLARYSQGSVTRVAARSLGIEPLRESVPALFEELVEEYAALIEVALEERLYRDARGGADRVRALGDQLGFLKAGPRDVVQIHHAALQKKSRGVTLSKARAYLEEGRIVMVELMGHLLSHYRNYALSVRAAATAAARAPEAASEPR